MGLMKKHLTLAIVLLLVTCSARTQAPPTVEGLVYLSEFQSLQMAVDAVPNGGTVIVPRGIWEGDVVIPAGKYVHIQGVSPAVIGQHPTLGHYQWDYLLLNYPDTFLNGSILRGTIDATANSSKLSMTNILMIGHGGGTAVKLGSSAAFGYGGALDNVSIGNYETGIQAVKMYNLSINKMQINGTGTALNIQDSNLVRLRDVDIMSCALGADLRGAITWQGGSVQACTDGVKAWLTAGYIGSLHFEQISNVSLFFDGYGSQLAPNFYTSNSGHAVINGYNNIIDFGWGNGVTEFTSKSKYNKVRMFGAVDDAGYANEINK